MASGRKTTGSKNVLVPPTRATGAGSATGHALGVAEHEIPKGKARGSTAPVAGPLAKPDLAGPHKPSGAQLEPAKFVSNGEIPLGIVPTPTGPVPAVTQEAADAHRERIDKELQARAENKITHKRLSAETIARLPRPELRAIAVQRGYDVPEAGTRATRAAFMAAQDADKRISKEK